MLCRCFTVVSPCFPGPIPMAIGSQAKDPATLEGREGIGVLRQAKRTRTSLSLGLWCLLLRHWIWPFIIFYPCKSTSFEQFLNYDRSCCDLSRQSLRPCHPSWFGTPLDFNPCCHELSRVGELQPWAVPSCLTEKLGKTRHVKEI